MIADTVIRFQDPSMLLLIVPWLLFGLYFAVCQVRACRWIWQHVGERARDRFTLYTRRTLGPSMALLLILGLLLVAAAAGPSLPGGQVRDLSVRVVLLLDASASMRATDIEVPGTPDEARQDRFEMARAIARELTQRLDGSFALVSFSGKAALQLPLTGDPGLQEEALRVVEVHNYYRFTGSSFGTALDRVLPFVDPGAEEGRERQQGIALQAVLLSDGEQPFPEPYEEPLAALAARGTPVHTVAIGSRDGQSRVIYDFRDIVARKDEPAALQDYTTRRQDEHLRRIADETGGRFEVAAPGAHPATIAEALAEGLRQHQTRVVSRHEEGRRDLSAWLMAAVLLGLVFEAVWLHPFRLPFLRRSRTRGLDGFDVRRLGSRKSPKPTAPTTLVALAGVSLLWLACYGDDPEILASVENGKGIEADRVLVHGKAQTHYERSRAYDFLPEIPTYNLARSVFLQHDYSAAHELYQQALELAPDLPQAHYNDGHALYRWGVMERDPRGCHLERTLELWQAARRRFETALELYPPKSQDAQRTQDNVDFLQERIETILQALKDPPVECKSPRYGLPHGVVAAGGGSSAGGSSNAPPSGPPKEEVQATDPEAQPPSSPTDEEGLAQEPTHTGLGGVEPRRPEPGPGAGGTSTGTAGRADPDRVAGNAPLSAEELDQVTRALERIRNQGQEGGKFHRRTRAEQFPASSWKTPDREIWW